LSSAGQLQNALAALPPGASQAVRLYSGTSLRAVSESDPTKSASATCR